MDRRQFIKGYLATEAASYLNGPTLSGTLNSRAIGKQNQTLLGRLESIESSLANG